MEIQQKVLVTAIIIYEGKILMQKRTDRHPDFFEKWTTPSGIVEINEHPQAAVIREIKEELNIDIEVLSVIPAIDSFPDHHHKYHLVYLAYLCKYISGEMANVDEDGDISEARWVPLAELKDLPLIRGTMPPIKMALSQNR